MFVAGVCFMSMLIEACDGHPGMAAINGLLFALSLALAL